MATYEIAVEISGYYYEDVEADSEEEACKIAERNAISPFGASDIQNVTVVDSEALS